MSWSDDFSNFGDIWGDMISWGFRVKWDCVWCYMIIDKDIVYYVFDNSVRFK